MSGRGGIGGVGRGSRLRKRPAHLTDYVLDEDLVEPLQKSPRFDCSSSSAATEDAEEPRSDIEVRMDRDSEDNFNQNCETDSLASAQGNIEPLQDIVNEDPLHDNMEDQLKRIVDSMTAMQTCMESMQKRIDEIQGKVNSSTPTEQSQSTPAEPVHVLRSSNSSLSGVASSTCSRSHKLIDLPIFDGNCNDWPNFIAEFNDTTFTEGYSTVQNNSRLKKCLTGAARKVVDSMLIHHANVPEVIERLRTRFGRPEKIIRAQMDIIREVVPINENSIHKLVPFADKVNNLKNILKSCESQHMLQNSTLLDELVIKLPLTQQVKWTKYRSTLSSLPSVEDFSCWLNELAAIIDVVPEPVAQPVSVKSKNAQDKKEKGRVLLVNENKQSVTCLFCGKNHQTQECSQYLNLDIDGRWKLVKDNKLCFNCLLKGHTIFRCKKKCCGEHGCKRRHHSTLHKVDLNVNAAPFQPDQQVASTTQSGRVMSAQLEEESSVLFKIIPITMYGPKGAKRTFGLLDEAATLTLVSRELADEIGLKGVKQSLSIKGIDNEAKILKAEIANARISGTFSGAKIFNMDGIRIVERLNLPEQSLNLEELYDKFNHLQNLPIEDFKNGIPHVLIGLQHAHLGTPTKVPMYSGKGPIPILTKLGYLLYGPKGVDDNKEIQRVLFTEAKPCFEDLHELVKRHYEVEDFGVKSVNQVESIGDKRALEILERTTRKIDGRFESGLIWKTDQVTFPKSYDMAVNRLYSVERKMMKSEPYELKYRQTISDYISKGYARRLYEEEVKKKTTRTWYLPHFGVINPNKPDKFRLVFDAAAKVHNVSLNSMLLAGPDLNQPLIKILWRFREKPIGVCGDIREMYHQVKIIKDDMDSQRFLWRDHPNGSIQEYVMESMTFGSSSSPTTAQFVKNKNALEYQDTYPEAVSAILESHYVDDYVSCFQNEEDAIRITKEVIEIHRQGGFELRNFISNSHTVTDVLNNGENSSNSLSMDINCEQSAEKILGMHWLVDSDSFTFRLKFSRIDDDILCFKRYPTKRELLAIAMSIYDPFGLMSTVTVYIKVLVQKVWKTSIQWDQTIPDNIAEEWKLWFMELRKVKDIQIPRCYSLFLTTSSRIELHTMVDASEIAFTAVCYLRVIYDGYVDIALVAGKVKCAPLKELSIPRLELQAAVLGTRLRNAILESHTFNVQRCFFWSDSMTVLFWVKDRECKYKQFVRNRVSEILDSTSSGDWYYVSSANNVADDATRDKYPPRFDSKCRWFTGPQWSKCEKDWPIQPLQLLRGRSEEEAVLLQDKHRVLLVHNVRMPCDVNEFSDYERLKRRFAWYRRFMLFLKSKVKGTTITKGSLLPSELQEAEIYLCRRAQMESFSEDYKILKENKNKKLSAELIRLMPYLDEQGVMRVYGRIDNAPSLPVFTKRPIILSKKHRLSFLIMKYFHEIHHHQFDELTVCEVRYRFWIISARTVLKSVKSQCSECIKSHAAPRQPSMGQLPRDRLTPYVRPFSYTGVDYFGPIEVAIGRRREKRWIALFTCLTIRAVHLEISENLSSDSFILCLRNFINLRGLPMQLRSDNGTNFVGAKAEMIKSSSFFGEATIKSECSKKGIVWKFNSPGDPSAGGAWERLVQCVKRVLKPLLRDVARRTETLRSFILEAANIVNSRPLTHLPLSCDDEHPLTPNSFLLGCPNSIQTPGPTDEKLWCLKKQWRISQGLKNHFYKRFNNEYLPTLTRREKWCTKVDPIKVGDLVLICDSDVDRKDWIKGWVEEVITAKDGQVRSAVVRNKVDGRRIRRPAAKLAVLDIVCRSSKDLDESTGGRMSPTDV